MGEGPHRGRIIRLSDVLVDSDLDMAGNEINDADVGLTARGSVNADTISLSKTHWVPSADPTHNDNVALPATGYVRAATTGATTISGFVAPTSGKADGYMLLLASLNTDAIVLEHSSSTSSVGNRIYTTTGLDVTLPARGKATFVYDTNIILGIGGWVLMHYDG